MKGPSGASGASGAPLAAALQRSNNFFDVSSSGTQRCARPVFAISLLHRFFIRAIFLDFANFLAISIYIYIYI